MLLNIYYPQLPVDLTTVQVALRVADKYNCPRVSLDVRRRLREEVFRNPWLIFGIASEMDDRDLAAAAITHFGGSDSLDGPSPRPAPSMVHSPPWSIEWSEHKHISYPFFAAYLRAWMSSLEHNESSPGVRTWSEVSYYFKLYMDESKPRSVSSRRYLCCRADPGRPRRSQCNCISSQQYVLIAGRLVATRRFGSRDLAATR